MQYFLTSLVFYYYILLRNNVLLRCFFCYYYYVMFFCLNFKVSLSFISLPVPLPRSPTQRTEAPTQQSEGLQSNDDDNNNNTTLYKYQHHIYNLICAPGAKQAEPSYTTQPKNALFHSQNIIQKNVVSYMREHGRLDLVGFFFLAGFFLHCHCRKL